MIPRRVLSTLGAAAALVLAAAPAAAMTKLQAQSNIAAKAAANPWVGSPNPATVYPALPSSGCPVSGFCSGWYEHFQNWVDIYTYDSAGSSQTHTVGGMILNGYNWFGDAAGFLGYPTTDELDTPGESGRNQYFNGGTLYYKWGASGSYEVNGWIEKKWNALGATTSALGFPTANESSYLSGRISTFEHGSVIWDGTAGSWQADTWPVLSVPSPSPATGAHWITGRLVSAAAPSYELYGCGFTASSSVTIHVNTPLQRGFLASTATDGQGCFSLQTPAISASFDVNGVLTFEVDDGGHFGVVGLPWASGDCYDSVSGTSYFMVSKTDRTIWCVEPSWWKANHAALLAYDLGFPDAVEVQLENDFGVPYPGPPNKVEIDNLPGSSCNYAGTPTTFGAGVYLPGACFQPASPGAAIFITQELVNAYTIFIAHAWPTDWWADHKSPFPSFVNWNLLSELGQTSAYQPEYAYNHGPGPVPYPGPDSDPHYQAGYGPVWDPQTLMFEGLKAQQGGWSGFASAFRALKNNQIQLDQVGANPSLLMSEYALAYLSLGHRQNLAPLAVQYGVGQRPYYYFSGTKLDCWTQNPGCFDLAVPNKDWPAYTPTSADVKAIADAHCQLASVEAAGFHPNEVSAGYGMLRSGNYAGASAEVIAYSTCVVGPCPIECGCDTQGRCAAPWQ